MQRYDAIIIGAGHNGLVAAAYLAKAGRKVMVLERRPFIGGAAVSEELYPGFTYSSCSYVCSLLRPEIMRGLDLPRHGLQVIPYETTACPTHEGEPLVLYHDADRNRRSIARHSLRDAEAYDAYSLEIRRQCRFIKPLLMMTPPDPTSFKWGDIEGLLRIGRTFGQMGERQMYDILRFWTMSISDFLDDYFESGIVKALNAGSSIIGTALGPRSPGSAYVLLHHYMGEVDGEVGAWGFARGGMGSVSKAIASAAREAGAEIRTQAEVTAVIVKGGKAAGVALADGEEIYGTAIVSNLDPKRTFLKILPRQHLSDEVYEQARQFKIRGSSGKLNIALDGLPRFKGLPEDATRGAIEIGDSLDYLERAFDDYKYGRWSRRPFLDIVIPSTVDPTMAPPGKHYMSVFVQYVPYKLADGPWTDEKRKAFGDTVIDTIEEYCPNFRDLILHCQVRTPWDLENEVGLTEGNIFHGELTLDQLLFNRPFPGVAQYRAPVRNFYLCGSGTHPGGGVMGAPGANAAREILKDFKARVLA